MVERELNFQLLHENNDLPDFDDAEEALSLCDLSLNNCATSDWNYGPSKDQSSFDQDFFEFFSEDFTAPTHLTDNIIFCGKLIPYKGATVDEKAQELEMATKPRNTKKSRIFPWRSLYFTKSRTTSSKQQQQQQQEKFYKNGKTFPVPSSKNKGYAAKRYVDKDELSMKKVSLIATPTKFKWHLSAFGVARIPMEMELTDIKMRQSKKSPAKMFQPEAGKEMRSRKSLWSLLKFLGCKGNHAHAMVMASFGSRQ